jgi:membrane protease YdiL (CAAX protease family)
VTFSPLLFADDALLTQPIWFNVLALAMLAASAWVWIRWQRSNSLGLDFFGPRDPRSESVRPWGQVVLVGFLAMFFLGTILIYLYLRNQQQVPAEPTPIERLTFQLDTMRLSVACSLITLSLVLGFSYLQVRITNGEAIPWIGLIPNWRDLRNGLLLGVACVPLLYIMQGFLQYLLVVVFQQPRVEHPLIELVRKNKDAESGLVTELMAWIALSVTVIAPVLEELLFRGLLQGWIRAKYQVVTGKMLATPSGVENVPRPETNNPYQASQVRLLTNPAELQRRRLTTWAPIFMASMAFALVHAGHGPAPIPLFFFSMALGYVYEKTGRLAPSIIAHLMLNLCTTIMLWLMISGRIPAE